MDEPTDGLDPNQKHEVRNLIRRMGENKAIIFSTHILEEVEAACSRAIIIDRGRIVANGTPAGAEGALGPRRRGAADRCAAPSAAAVAEAVGRAADASSRSRSLSDEPSRAVIRVYPDKSRARRRVRRAGRRGGAAEGWKIEQLHTEEGRLDEVFRRITLPDTVEGGHESAWANIKTIAKRELGGYFASPVAYVFLVIFLLLAGFFTFTVGELLRARRGLARRRSSRWHPWLYLFLVPAVGMRLWSEERRLRHDRAAAHHADHAVAGDRRQVPRLLVFLALALALTFPVVLTVNWLGDPDNGVIFAGYVGSLLLAGTYLAVSCMTSAMTRNQVISFILSVVICLFLILAGYTPVTDCSRAGRTRRVVERDRRLLA